MVIVKVKLLREIFSPNILMLQFSLIYWYAGIAAQDHLMNEDSNATIHRYCTITLQWKNGQKEGVKYNQINYKYFNYVKTTIYMKCRWPKYRVKSV
jgi:hypothetical protein